MNYTKGEWKVSIPISDKRIISCDGIPIGEVYCSRKYSTTNAHLIAAAPEMYKALKAIINKRTECHETEAAYIPPEIELAYKALAKAEGK